VWTWAEAAGSNRTSSDFQFSTEEQYQEAEYPSVHDERYGQSPVVASEQPPGEADPYCNSNNGTTSIFELSARNKCARRLVRPVFIWGSEGQYMVKVSLLPLTPATKRLRIVTLGISGGRSLMRPFHDRPPISLYTRL
jgi:hypothetical protein